MTRYALLALVCLVAGCAQPEAPRPAVVFFPADSAALTLEGKQVVEKVALTARETKPAKIFIEGHADGGTARDATLANERARTIMNELGRAGVATPIELSQGAPPTAAAGVEAHKAVIRLVP